MRASPLGSSRRPCAKWIAAGAAFAVLVANVVGAAPGAGRAADGAVHTPHDDVSAVALSPQFASDRTLFAIVRDRLFCARDGGRQWERVSRGLSAAPLRDVAVSPAFASDRTVFVAAYEGPYRSSDGGVTWQRVGGADAPARLVSVHVSPSAKRANTLVVVDKDGAIARSDDAGSTWTRDVDAPLVAALAWREAADGAHDTLFVAAIDGACWTSQDGGVSWTVLGRLPDGVRASSIAPADDGHSWWIGSEGHGVWRAFGEPLEFEVVDGDVAGGRVSGLASVGTGEERTLLASTWRGGPRRFDASANDFVERSAPLETHAQAERIDRPSFGPMAAHGDEVFLATFCGLVHSSDGGRTWEELETLPRHLVMALDVVAVDRDAVAIALSTYGAGVSISRDGGATWTTSNRGLDSARTMGVALSPNFGVDARVTSGSYDAIVHSSDGGARWTRIGVGSPGAKGGTLSDEDTRPSPVLVAYSPDFQRDRTVFAALHPSGFMRSRDGGATFDRVGAGLEGGPSALAVSPDFEHDRTVFFATRSGLFVSRDAGARFEALQSGRNFQNCFTALSPNFGEDAIVFAGGVEGLSVSRDGGLTFTAVDLAPGEAAERIAGIAVAPNFASSREFLVQVRGGDLFVCRDEPTGIVSEVSTAGRNGLEFCALASFVREVDPLVVYSPNYERDRTIWASDSLGLFASTDGGRTFTGVARTTRVEASHVAFDGGWHSVKRPALGLVLRSTVAGSRAWLNFVGTEAVWVGSRGPTMGRADVCVDGIVVASVDLYAEKEEHGVVLHTARGLAAGPHRIEIVVTGRADAAGESRPAVDARRVVDVEAFEIRLAP